MTIWRLVGDASDERLQEFEDQFTMCTRFQSGFEEETREVEETRKRGWRGKLNSGREKKTLSASPFVTLSTSLILEGSLY